jgi:hypothetical protein
MDIMSKTMAYRSNKECVSLRIVISRSTATVM